MLFGQLQDENNVINNKKFPDVDLIEGGFFMGSFKAIRGFKEQFWNLHDQFLNEGKFIGKDQIIMNAYAVNSSTKSVKLQIWKRNCQASFDEWFFYQRFLAKQEYYRSCSTPKLSLLSL